MSRRARGSIAFPLEFALKLVGLGVASALGYGMRLGRRLLGRGGGDGERFVRFERRSWNSDVPFSRQLIRSVQASKWNERREGLPPVHWKGVLNMKDPFALSVYPMLLWELRPATVIEIGSFNGGSASWLADMMEAQGIDGRVYSFDIDLDRIEARHPRVEFRRADSNDPSTLDLPWLANLPHPWLVIEDAHTNIHALLGVLAERMAPGDYLVVEDTFWSTKYKEFSRFALDQKGAFLVDTRYTDVFGYNVTWNPNSYLKKVE